MVNALVYFGAYGAGLVGILLLLSLLVLIFEIWMFVDVIRNPRLTTDYKLIWALGMLFIHPFVAIAYYFVARSNKDA